MAEKLYVLAKEVEFTGNLAFLYLSLTPQMQSKHYLRRNTHLT